MPPISPHGRARARLLTIAIALLALVVAMPAAAGTTAKERMAAAAATPNKSKPAKSKAAKRKTAKSKAAKRKAAKRRAAKRRARARAKRRRAAAAGAGVTWKAPRAGQTVTGFLGSWSCEVAVTGSGIRYVDFFVDGKALNRELGAPWQCKWDSSRYSAGTHTLKATARYSSGSSKSASIKVYVKTPSTAPAPTTPTTGEPEPTPAPAPAPAPSPEPEPTPEPTPTPPPPTTGQCTSPAPYPAQLHTVQPSAAGGDASRSFVDPNNCKVVLNGFNMFPLWQNPEPRMAWSQADYTSIRAKGFTAVRFLLPWRMYEPQKGQFAYMAELDKAVSYARNAGLYVVFLNIIVDGWNSPPTWATGTDKIDQIHKNARGWTQELARRYKSEPAVAGYDLASELPTNDQNRLLRVYSDMTDWVRAVDASKVVLTSAGYGNNSMAKADPTLLRHKKNVVHTWHHYYGGGAGEGYNQYGMNSGTQLWDGKTGYPGGRIADLEAQVKHHIAWGNKADVPIWVGEYGIGFASTGSLTWATEMGILLRKYGIGRAYWIYDKGSSLFAIKNSDGSWRPIADVIR